MDLTTVSALMPLRDRGDTVWWTPRSAWLAGGTWLFSEPQPHLETLLDLSTLDWPPILLDEHGLTISATCTFAQLMALQVPPDLIGLTLIEPCCRALLGSFKVWNVATVGGNICLALPAAPMVALAVALDGLGEVWLPGGTTRHVPIADFVVGPMQTVLEPGEILRAITLPMVALHRRTAFRRASLTTGGRSAALLIGTWDGEAFTLTITAATPRPIRIAFSQGPSAGSLCETIDTMLPTEAYYDDVHGRQDWRRHLTRMLAEEIRAELVGP